MSGDWQRIDRYVTGEMSSADAEEFEDELFGGELSGVPLVATVAEYDQLVRAVVDALGRGSFQCAVAPEDAARYALDTERVHLITMPIETPHYPVVEVDLDKEFVLTRYELPLADVDQIDMEIVMHDGSILKTMPDLEFDGPGGALHMMCDMSAAKEAAVHAHQFSTRFMVTRGGERTELASFTFGAIKFVGGHAKV